MLPNESAKKVIQLRKDNEAEDRLATAEEEYKDGMIRLVYVHQYTGLMLNPEEELHKQMLDLLSNRINELTDRELSTPKDQWPDFATLSRKILKTEWKRVRTEMKEL